MMDEWLTKKIDSYIIVNQKLGRGSYGVVFRGYLEADEKQHVAAKQIPMKDICKSLSRVKQIKNEIDNLQKINSKYVVKLHAVSRTQTNLYMFLEYCMDGDLKSYLKRKEGKMLSEPEAIQFFRHIVEGFKELYKNSIIHRDIKPANILMSKGNLKLADFGFSRVIEDEQARNHSFLGSPLYMAPQILDQKAFSSKCDVWSVGIVFYEILYGKTPWNGNSQFQLIANIRDQPLIFPEEPVRSSKVKNLLRKMLQYNEKDRISWPKIFEDDLIVGVRKSMEQSLRKMDMVECALEKSVLENEAYIQKNLVANYLQNIDEEDDIDERNKNLKLNQFKTTDDDDDNEYEDCFEENHQEIMDEMNSGGQMKVKQLQFKSKAMSANSISQNSQQPFMSNQSEFQIHSQQNLEKNGKEVGNKQEEEEQKTSKQKQGSSEQRVRKYDDEQQQFRETKEENYMFEEKAELLIQEQIEAEKMRKNILKVNEYMLYERNVSFFYNFVIQKLISGFNENVLNIGYDLHYRVVFIISKCQNINLNRINAMLSSPKTEFNQTIWDCYQSSLDFLKTQKLLVQDIWFAKKFFNELLKKTAQIVDETHKKATAEQAAVLEKFKKALNVTMIQDSTFKSIYQKTISEAINLIKHQANSNNKEVLIMIKFLIVCQNPYSVFNNSDFDFNKFYEQLENIKVQQLRQEILQHACFKEQQ